jgi:hypothetical protein
MMKVIFGRRKYSFSGGAVELTGTSITERSLKGEGENAFTRRLMKLYGNRKGTIEIVFKMGNPDYAIVSFD